MNEEQVTISKKEYDILLSLKELCEEPDVRNALFSYCHIEIYDYLYPDETDNK